jgi:hypothetical protein
MVMTERAENPSRYHHITALIRKVRLRLLLESLAPLALCTMPAGLTWAQDQVECQPGFHLEGAKIITGPGGGPTLVGGHCVRDESGTRTIFVDWQNSGNQDGTAEHPYRTVSQALAAAAPGNIIVIRTGSYTFQDGPLVFNKSATVRGDNGPVIVGTPSTWLDAQTGRPSPNPAPYDLVTRAFDPDNGLPLNPFLGSQTWPSHQLADPALCGAFPWLPPCTTQKIWIDNNVDKCRLSEGPLKGHANWGFALYEGRIHWENHSYYLQDDDYSFALWRPDLAGMTKVDVEKGFPQGYLHSEFNSDQTINHFHTWYWDLLHQSVDEDTGGKGGVLGSWRDIKIPIPPYTKTRPIFDGKEAIIVGLYGMDCAHDCGAELHPVLAFAIHLNENDVLNDDTWAIFVRNWGDEGYCSSGQEEMNPGSAFHFSFRFKKPGATQVEIISAEPSDPKGQHGTVFLSNKGESESSWSLVLIPNEGAVVSFNLPPPSERGRINGMLHLKWSVAADHPTSQFLSVRTPPQELLAGRAGGEHEEAEGLTTELIQRLTPNQGAAIERAWMNGEPSSPDEVRLAPVEAPALPPATPLATMQGKQVSDPIREQKEQRLRELLQQMGLPH